MYFNRDSASTLSQFSTYVETASNSQKLDIDHIQAYVNGELQRQNSLANQTKERCEQRLIQLQNQLEDVRITVTLKDNLHLVLTRSLYILHYTSILRVYRFKEVYTSLQLIK